MGGTIKRGRKVSSTHRPRNDIRKKRSLRKRDEVDGRKRDCEAAAELQVAGSRLRLQATRRFSRFRVCRHERSQIGLIIFVFLLRSEISQRESHSADLMSNYCLSTVTELLWQRKVTTEPVDLCQVQFCDGPMTAHQQTGEAHRPEVEVSLW